MSNNLSGVAKTLFIPLWARIYVSKHFPKYFYDEVALNLENKFDFSEVASKSNEYQIMANCARAFVFNKIISNFISKNQKCNLIYLGVGLDTSMNYFAKSNNVFCYGIDFADVISLRKELYQNENLITSDIFDTSWFDKIEDKTIPTLIIAAGVFQYCEESKIVELINNIKNLFANGELLFDATNKYGMKYANKYIRKTGNNTFIQFYINDINYLTSKTQTILLQEKTFFKETRNILKKELRFITKLFMTIVDKKKRAQIFYIKI